VTSEPADRPRASVFIATSVDGFIARPDDGLDWLTGKPDDELTGDQPSGEDYGYGEFFASVDALVMGRGTYDVVQGFDGWYYDDKPVYVWTSHPEDLEPPQGALVRPVAGTLGDVVARLIADGIGHVYVDGGKVIRQFLAAGLIDRMTISTPPILIGEGIPLFADVAMDDVRLELVSCETFDGGMVQRTYDVVR
jgi:dihydrofolate reductase